jgi:hypothetical protein
MTLEQSQRTLARARAKAHKTVDDFPLVEITGVSNRLELRRVTGLLGAESVFVDVTGVTEDLIDYDLIRVWPQPDKAGIYKFHSFVKRDGTNMVGDVFVPGLQTNLIKGPHGFTVEVFDATGHPGEGHQSKLEWSQAGGVWRIHAADDGAAAGLDVQKGNISLAAGYTVDGVDVSGLDNDAIKKTLVDAKGDLIVATADDTVTRLAVGGTDGSILIESSGAGAGLAWSTQLKLGATETVINDAGADVDFRVEGDTDTQLIVGDAGLDAVAIGGAADSTYKFKLYGMFGIDLPTSAAGNHDIVFREAGSHVYVAMECYSTNAAYHPIMGWQKSHSDVLGTLTTTINGETLGRMTWSGILTNNTGRGAVYLQAEQDGAATATTVPGRLVIYTDHSTGRNPRLTIYSTGAVLVNGFIPTAVGLTVRGAASQTAHMQDWQESDGTLYMSVSENGYLKIKKTAAPADAELDNNELAFWWDQANSKMMVKAKDNGGNVVAGELALA